MWLSTSRLLGFLLRTVGGAFGETCALCGDASAANQLCAPCRADLVGIDLPRCPVCAEQMPTSEVCGRCLRQPPAFQRVVTAAGYEFPLDALIQRLKYASDLTLIVPLGSFLATRVRAQAKPDLIIGMPLSAERLRERGFNQANELARVVARELGVPFLPDLCRRVRHAAPQASLPLDARRRNVRGAFACNDNLQGRYVAVVDDVLTTGASLDELARTLLRAGAGEVAGWVVARTPPPR